MPPSQLKQLKASLRGSGVLGSQKRKKQRKTDNKDAQKRNQRNVALGEIRERFNPFEAKAPGRREKFELTSNKPTKKAVERPGVTRGLGEERRRETLLKEMQRRNKVGGLLDRRFGEDDPNMTPEQKSAERFAQQALRANRKNSMFNLEEESEEESQLTHGGRALALDDPIAKDDFDETFSVSDADEFDAQDDRPRKRARSEDEGHIDEDDEAPQRKKSKNEVMQEVIAKSKAYKAARQAVKEDDDDLRIELNKGMGDLFSALRGTTTHPKQLPSPPNTDSEPTLDPSRAAMLAGKSRDDAEREYEANLRQLKLEARSKPSVRTKSDEEKAAEEKARLEELERRRLRRMKGEAEVSDEELEGDGVEVDGDVDDADAFGLEQPISEPRYIPQLDVEDEDQFVFDDLVASDSDVDSNSVSTENDVSSIPEEGLHDGDDGDDDFINGLVLPRPTSSTNTTHLTTLEAPRTLPFTFPCPQDHDELIAAMREVEARDLPTAVQRIRALYHKGLAKGNEAKLGRFANAMIPWIVELVNGKSHHKPTTMQVEQLIRHLHSMAKSQPVEVAAGFRDHFRRLLHQRRKTLDAGNLIILTSVSTIYPTSDQWHSVVTPAMSLLARYLAQAPIGCFSDLVEATYACSLLLRFQAVSRRYVPEIVNFICKGLHLLAPRNEIVLTESLMTPKDGGPTDFRITRPSIGPVSSQLSFEHVRISSGVGWTTQSPEITSESLLSAFVDLATVCINLYSSKTAFSELIAPLQTLFIMLLSQDTKRPLLSPTTIFKILRTSNMLNCAVETCINKRKPLLLHDHRPLAIKSSYPSFTDNYNPERRYQDPDHERAELNKLKAEHKKEKKGAMRELRKDANFTAREQLREKKARDEAYEKKFKKLVAEIQGEEGREAKQYERERTKRKGKF